MVKVCAAIGCREKGSKENRLRGVRRPMKFMPRPVYEYYMIHKNEYFL